MPAQWTVPVLDLLFLILGTSIGGHISLELEQEHDYNLWNSDKMAP